MKQSPTSRDGQLQRAVTYKLPEQEGASFNLDRPSNEVSDAEGSDDEQQRYQRYRQDALLEQQRQVKTATTVTGVGTERVIDTGARRGHRCRPSLMERNSVQRFMQCIVYHARRKRDMFCSRLRVTKNIEKAFEAVLPAGRRSIFLWRKPPVPFHA